MCLLQFNGFFVTVESLFCILNGDDLYKTFEGIEVRFTLANVIQLFSKFYLCTFIFLFIYIILSLFIGIFNQAYESLSVSHLLITHTHTHKCIYIHIRTYYRLSITDNK